MWPVVGSRLGQRYQRGLENVQGSFLDGSEDPSKGFSGYFEDSGSR